MWSSTNRNGVCDLGSTRVESHGRIAACFPRRAALWALVVATASVAAADEKPPADKHQQVAIPCIECRILHPGLKDCKVCGGKGTVLQAARFADKDQQRRMGKERREKVEAALEKVFEMDLRFDRPASPPSPADRRIAWKKVAEELEVTLKEMAAYGWSYVRGFMLSGSLEINGFLNPTDAELQDEEIASAHRDVVRALFRLMVLEARRRSAE